VKTLTTKTSGKSRASVFSGSLQWLLGNGRLERAALVLLIIVVPFLMFHNLELNPRPWHDEGTALSLSKTLAKDGVYAVRSLDDYQTFGAAQSVGPTILVPIAWSFKLFGVGLMQGRLVMAAFSLLTLALFYLCGVRLFGRQAALFAVFFMLASQGVGYFIYGRPVMGEVPALGLFLGGWLAWSSRSMPAMTWSFSPGAGSAG
jgi:hypothetical protein